MIKNTYGTGSFLLLHTGRERFNPGGGLLSTVVWALGDLNHVEYAVEGSVFVAGAAVQWLRYQLGLIQTAAETEEISLSVPDTGGVYFVPAFVGMGAPHWDPYARGTIVGITRGTRKEHLVRATLEAIGFQIKDLVDTIASATGIPPQKMRADGGAAANRFLLQFQADLLGAAVERPKFLETTALGAAYLAGLSVGVWRDQGAGPPLAAGRGVYTPDRRPRAGEAASRMAAGRRASQRLGAVLTGIIRNPLHVVGIQTVAQRRVDQLPAGVDQLVIFPV